MDSSIVNNWDEFWSTRDAYIPDNNLGPFDENFFVFHRKLVDHYDRLSFKGYTSLEVECGRGTMSSFLGTLGINTHGMDHGDYGLDRMRDAAIDRHWKGDALSVGDYRSKYDIVFTYGLLEHFEVKEQVKVIQNCQCALKHGGIQLHYIVPRKFTNRNEDSSVYRDKCMAVRRAYKLTWVYPVTYDTWLYNGSWVTNNIFGKGAIFADTCTNYG